MEIIYFIPVLALMLLAIDYRITAGNMNVPWNGYGCVKDVVRGRSMLPMQYRVFVPWLTWIAGGTVSSYLSVKYAGLVFMLYCFAGWLNVLGVDVVTGTLALCALIPVTMKYDYADAYWELGFFALAFSLIYTGESIWVLSLVIFMGILNRETNIIIVPAYFVNNILLNHAGMDLMGGFIVILAISFSLMVPRMVYGWNRRRYCKFNLIKTNIEKIRKGENLPDYFMSLCIICGFLFLTVIGWSVLLFPIMASLLILLITIIIPGMWDESRIFLPLTTIMIPLMIRGF